MKLGKLTFFCGKMGAGKSTKAKHIAEISAAVLLVEDDWLAALYPDQIRSIKDYVHYSGLLKPQIKTLVQSILQSGSDVVMDFPANTLQQRAWFKSLLMETNAEHELVFIDVADAVCLAQIQQRRMEEPQRAATDTPEMFAQMNRYFVAPSAEEGFNITSMA